MAWVGPYVATSWVNGTTPLSQTNMNHLEQQYQAATQTFEQDLFTGFVLFGMVATKDGSIATQLDTTTGVAFLLQTDSTVARQSIASTSGSLVTTGHPSATLFLDLNPNGTFNFATTHSAVTGHLTICTVTTDGSSNILTVTDTRPKTTSMFSAGIAPIGMQNGISLDPAAIHGEAVNSLQIIGVIGATSQADIQIKNNNGGFIYLVGQNAFASVDLNGVLLAQTLSLNTLPGGLTGLSAGGQIASAGGTVHSVQYWTQQAGTANGHEFVTWDGSATQVPLTLGSTALAGGSALNQQGGFVWVAGQSTAGSFGVPVIVAQAIGTHVTSTGDQVILTYAPTGQGVYAIYGYAFFGNGSSEAVTFRVTWGDPNGGTSTAYFYSTASGAAGFLLNGSETPISSSNSIATQALTIYAKTGTNIIVHWNDPAGTPNDFVTAIIVRIS